MKGRKLLGILAIVVSLFVGTTSPSIGQQTVSKSSHKPSGTGSGGGTRIMGRLRTIGYESGLTVSTNVKPYVQADGHSHNFNTTRQAVVVRSGDFAAKCDTGVSNAFDYHEFDLYSSEQAFDRGYYVRAYFYFTSFPNTTIGILTFATDVDAGAADSPQGQVRITSGGVLQLWHRGSAPVQQFGSDSSALSLNTWYQVELYMKIGSGAADDELAARLEGVQFASTAGQTFSNHTIHTVACGWWDSGGGASKVLYVDDVALNDDQGASQNSWPGAGKIVLLKPVSDNAVGTGWVDGDGAGTLFGSVDNSPPVGVNVAADGTQIKNLTSTATGNYDANMTSYSTAGLVSTDTITLVQAFCDHGEEASPGTKNGAIQIVSNPAQVSEDSFIYGDDSGADGTWSTGWRTSWGTAQYGPSVTLATSPILRVGKRTATTREVHVDAMGIYVEYNNGAVGSATTHKLALVGVGR